MPSGHECRGLQKYRGSGNPAIGALVVHKPLGPCRAAMTWQDDAWRASYLPPARGAPDTGPALGFSLARGFFCEPSSGRAKWASGSAVPDILDLYNVNAIYVDCDDAGVRLIEIAENLHRADLTIQERSAHVAEWIRLTEAKIDSMKLAKFARNPKAQGGWAEGVRHRRSIARVGNSKDERAAGRQVRPGTGVAEVSNRVDGRARSQSMTHAAIGYYL